MWKVNANQPLSLLCLLLSIFALTSSFSFFPLSLTVSSSWSSRKQWQNSLWRWVRFFILFYFIFLRYLTWVWINLEKDLFSSAFGFAMKLFGFLWLLFYLDFSPWLFIFLSLLVLLDFNYDYYFYLIAQVLCLIWVNLESWTNGVRLLQRIWLYCLKKNFLLLNLVVL